MRKGFVLIVFVCVVATLPSAQTPPPSPEVIVLRPARVFDGEVMHEGWAVRGRGDRIDAWGPAASVAAPGARVGGLPATTVTPALVEAHTPVLLHPYNATTWNDQVLHEG